MIGTIRKHSKSLWWIIIFAIIITFVYWGSSTSRTGGSGGGPGSFGRMNGETITVNRYADARNEVYLMYFFASGGSWPDRGRAVAGFDVERETFFRLFLIQKQEAMGVHVSEEALARVASERLRSMNRGNPVPPDVFAKQVLAPQGLTIRDFERYLRHELGLQQMASVVGLGGELVTPQEVRALYQREHQELQAQAVFFAATNYLASVSLTPEKVAQFFTNQMARYRLPERVQVNYVKFALSNFLAEAQHDLDQITNLNEVIEAKYQELGTNYFSEAKSPAEAKEKIRQMALNESALAAGRKKAIEFATELFNQTPVSPDNLATLAKAKGLTPQVTPPFDRDEPPTGLDVRADFIRAAFGLTEEEPFSQTLMGNDGVYLISLNKKLPSEIPSLDSIRPQVTQDYRFVEAVMAARKAAMEFTSTATNITSVPSFTAACAVAKVKPVTLPPFSLSTRDLELVTNHVTVSQFKQAAFSTAPGQMSTLQPSSDGAFVVFVQAKLPLDESKMAVNLPAFERSVRQARRSEAFNEWFNQEFNKVKSGIPYFQQKAEMSGLPKP
jgi:parvulin-like peptidyl-prolyl isomerase